MRVWLLDPYGQHLAASGRTVLIQRFAANVNLPWSDQSVVRQAPLSIHDG